MTSEEVVNYHEYMRINKYHGFLIGFLLQNIIYWIGIRFSHVSSDIELPIFLLYSFSNGFMGTIAGILGLLVAKHWGGSKSAVGKGILLISLGTTSWGVGTLIWSFYNFVLHIPVPYPSLADLGYILAVPLWILGIFYLSKATGVQYALKNRNRQIYLIILPIISFIFSYYLLVTLGRDGEITSGGSVIKIFFDFAYPLGDVIIVTIALLVYGLSLKYLGGKYKWSVVTILLGFVGMYISDFTFAYTTTIKTYYNGDIADLLFTIALFIISYGVFCFDVKET